MKLRILCALPIVAALGFGLSAAKAETTACLITKTDSNPFFVKMKEGALAESKKLGIELLTFAGRIDGDNEAQVNAIENCVASGAKGILITPSDSKAIVPTIRRARNEGVLVIALDTPLEPVGAADATFATDNFRAGELIGEWAAKKLGADAANAKIALLDLNPSQVTVDVARDQGFLTGFGIDTVNPAVIGDETDPRIVGNEVTNGNEEGGRTAMEILLQIDPSINLIYTINEPAAAGAYEALKAVGLENQALIVSVDGGCPGVRNVDDGVLGATSMQFPLLMASLGIAAIDKFAKTGIKPKIDPRVGFVDTGVELITDEPVDGLPSLTSEVGLERCWG